MTHKISRSKGEPAAAPAIRARRLPALGEVLPATHAATTVRQDRVASSAIRVLCVDDHAVLVEGLRAQFAISGDIEIVGWLSTAAALLEEVARLRPHAVLLDIEMPGPDVFEVADRLKRSHPEVRILVLSAHIRDSFITASFTAGACAYFAKSDDLADILGGIHEVMQSTTGTFVLGPKVRERCSPRTTPTKLGGRRDRTGQPTTLLEALTERETEVLRLIGKGLTRTLIAKQLCRSVKTIDGHQERMMKKLGIVSRADLMRLAIREGLAQA